LREGEVSEVKAIILMPVNMLICDRASQGHDVTAKQIKNILLCLLFRQWSVEVVSMQYNTQIITVYVNGLIRGLWLAGLASMKEQCRKDPSNKFSSVI
jgi:hypothetical protein